MIIDEFDAKILSELQNDGGLTAEALGGRVNLSASAVTKRLKRLNEFGIIERYVAVLDLKRLGASITALVICTFDPDGPVVRDEIGGLLRDRSEITNVWVLTGEVDLGFTVVTPTLEECVQSLRVLQRDLPQLRNLKEHIVTDQPKRSLAVPFPLVGREVLLAD